MAFIDKGFTFTDNVQDQMTANALATFVSNCTITGIALTEWRTSAHVVQVAAAIPASDQGEGSLWFDTTLNVLRQKNGSRWDCFYDGPGMLNSSGSALATGAWVVPSADNTMALCMTAEWPEVLGITTSQVADSARGIARRTGFGPARCIGPLTYGDVLVAASSVEGFGQGGYAKAATMVAGYGNTSFTAGIEIGMALGSIAGSTTGTVTCMVWR